MMAQFDVVDGRHFEPDISNCSSLWLQWVVIIRDSVYVTAITRSDRLGRTTQGKTVARESIRHWL